MKKKMHFTIMGLVVAVLALALALTGCAKDASGNTNAISSGMQEKGSEFILEFIDDRTCVALMTHWGRVSAVSENPYKIAGDKLVIRGDYTDSSYENGTIVLTTSSNEKFQYKITNYPIIKPEINYVSEEAAQEAKLRYNAEDSTDSNTESAS